MSRLEKLACFNLGITAVAGSAQTFAAILGDDTSILEAYANGTVDGNYTYFNVNGNSKTDDLEATECAIKYKKGEACSAGVAAVDGTPLTTTFEDDSTDANESDTTFSVVHVTVTATSTGIQFGDSTYERLAYQYSGSWTTVLTSGFCTNTFDPCTVDANATSVYSDAACFPCPIFDDEGNPQSMATVLVDALNNGIDSVAAMISSDDSDVADDIDQVKEDVCGDPNTTLCTTENGELVVTEDAVFEYLSKDNN